jgi:hypothetical protein
VSLGYPKCFKRLKVLSFKVLVCDWNVRAWTLLEAIRGRRSIYLLCKYNKVLSLRETLEIVHREGSISLSILFLTAQHLLPPPDKDLNETFPSKLYFDMKSKGFVSIEEAGSLLSWRQASRPGDDIVIWSLLVGDEKFNDAKSLWGSKIDSIQRAVSTGFLVSSASRVKDVPGMGWAPAHPTLDRAAGKVYVADDGHGSQTGVMTEEGLKSYWGVHAFESSHDLLLPYQFAVHQTAKAQSEHEYRWLGLFQALAWDIGFEYARTARRYRGNARGPLFAICGSDDRKVWTWIGVYEWATDKPLPEFTSDNVLLI